MDLRQQVEAALDEVRPTMLADGGNVELVEVTDDGIVRVRLMGACGSCPMATVTLKMGIERVLLERVPQVKQVVQVG
ncbi:MAG: NifU family protein [Desulfuromonas thiophila]|jgi:Fe-S cluster biogenesis protein NfuA|uniref:Fe-S cluster biogenesis protein NfuA, 4Fe-4S-binding domain n=1 Tax=Desulfuromonas thiophila TaxID=57664 RepID=A0A1G6Z3R1_9BACT|nr:NifU family protein [Desulfuromonas thiophila]MDY0397227.1 NifU family protein [Desulfuromonas thiophila]SDD97171.1 Fe-S cluster biogenesis protein NfuA, 4Fe-4S-binding domain [Desulfuromonas thiophila]